MASPGPAAQLDTTAVDIPTVQSSDEDDDKPLERRVSFAAEVVVSHEGSDDDGKLSGGWTPSNDGAKKSSRKYAAAIEKANGDMAATAPQQKSDSSSEHDDIEERSQPSSSTSSSNSASKNTGVSVIRCGTTVFRVPFTTWTFLAMLVPIAIVVAITSINMSTAAAELNAVNGHVKLMKLLSLCQDALTDERDASGPWLAAGQQDDWDLLMSTQSIVDDLCINQYATELRRLASDSSDFRIQFDENDTALREMAVIRSDVENKRTTGPLARAFYTQLNDNITDSITTVAGFLTLDARDFAELRLIMAARNAISSLRGPGDEMQEITSGSIPSDLVSEFSQSYGMAIASTRTLIGLASSELRPLVDEWSSSNYTVEFWALAFKVNQNSSLIYSSEASNWDNLVATTTDLLIVAQNAHLDYLARAQKASDQVATNAGVLGGGIVLCLIAAGLLALQQTRVRGELEEQVIRISRTKRAVSAFVPRFFLRQMGYTAITQVRSGECTKVALAMLFADIRHFTTVAEGMSCEQLFDWVQGYFRRMTSIIESRRGNVNQFIGDALFAVFTDPMDSVRCGIAMHSNVLQLNVQRLCGVGAAAHVPVEIGVGIHHDVVALGILGDETRHTCTTIAASVNLASRLEGLTKQLGCRVLVSDAVMCQLTDVQRGTILSRRIGRVIVKGSRQPVLVHDIFQADERELQLYKIDTKDMFERVCEAVVDSRATSTGGGNASGAPSSASSVAGEEPPKLDFPLPHAVEPNNSPGQASGEALPESSQISHDRRPLLQTAPTTNTLLSGTSFSTSLSGANSSMPNTIRLAQRLASTEHQLSEREAILQATQPHIAAMLKRLHEAERDYDVVDFALHEIVNRAKPGRGALSFYNK